MGFLLEYAVTFGLGFLLMMFVPNRMRRIEQELKTDPLRCGLTGVVGTVAFFALTILLALASVVLIGIPFLLALLLIVGVGMVMGMSAVANEIGMRLPFFKGRKTQAIVLAVGLFTMLLVQHVPYLGPLATAVLLCMAFGAVIRTRFGGVRRQGLPEPVDTNVPA